jgi:hypothetical protein
MRKFVFLFVFLIGCQGIMEPPMDLIIVQTSLTHTVWGVFIQGYIDNTGQDTEVKVIAELYDNDKMVASNYRTVFIYSGEHKYFNVALFFEKEFTRYKVRLEEL